MAKYYQGFFKPKNPNKYKGNVGNIVYRSSWELKFMNYLDTHPDVLMWASEELAIEYISPIDEKVHRYFPDFIFKRRNRDGETKIFMVEIKPEIQTQQPKVAKKKTKRYLQENMTYQVNQAKWKAARNYCQNRGWSFEIVTEKTLYRKKA